MQKKDIKITFTQEERDYIVNNHETDLMLTEVGMSLIERFTTSDTGLFINTSDSNATEFVAVLREEYICKVNRISHPDILRGLARRLLIDFTTIKTEQYC